MNRRKILLEIGNFDDTENGKAEWKKLIKLVPEYLQNEKSQLLKLTENHRQTNCNEMKSNAQILLYEMDEKLKIQTDQLEGLHKVVQHRKDYFQRLCQVLEPVAQNLVVLYRQKSYLKKLEEMDRISDNATSALANSQLDIATDLYFDLVSVYETIDGSHAEMMVLFYDR